MAFKPTCQTEHTSSQFKWLKKKKSVLKTRKDLSVLKKTALFLESKLIKRCINNFSASKLSWSQAAQLDIISFAMGIYQSHHSSQFCLCLFSFSCILSSFSHQATIQSLVIKPVFLHWCSEGHFPPQHQYSRQHSNKILSNHSNHHWKNWTILTVSSGSTVRNNAKSHISRFQFEFQIHI